VKDGNARHFLKNPRVVIAKKFSSEQKSNRVIGLAPELALLMPERSREFDSSKIVVVTQSDKAITGHENRRSLCDFDGAWHCVRHERTSGASLHSRPRGRRTDHKAGHDSRAPPRLHDVDHRRSDFILPIGLWLALAWLVLTLILTVSVVNHIA
jgi:hypothetical protein